MTRVYIGVGSNLGDRALNCERAIDEISGFADVSAVSSFYETEPVGNEDQPFFINSVVEIKTDLNPHGLLERLHSIERKLGRVRWGQRRALHSDAGAGIKSENRGERRTAMLGYEKWGPRTIDLDIIFFGEEIIDDPDLKVPHPETQRRRFVLEPLFEIAPELIHPVFKVSVKELLEEIKDPHKVVKLERLSTHDPQ